MNIILFVFIMIVIFIQLKQKIRKIMCRKWMAYSLYI